MSNLCFFYYRYPRPTVLSSASSLSPECYLYNEDREGDGGAVDVRAVREMRMVVNSKEMKGEACGIEGFWVVMASSVVGYVEGGVEADL
ncbi:hypothetical protein U1Q18_019700 [Sarracenia purpurea var. burkii]